MCLYTQKITLELYTQNQKQLPLEREAGVCKIGIGERCSLDMLLSSRITILQLKTKNKASTCSHSCGHYYQNIPTMQQHGQNPNWELKDQVLILYLYGMMGKCFLQLQYSDQKRNKIYHIHIYKTFQSIIQGLSVEEEKKTRLLS